MTKDAKGNRNIMVKELHHMLLNVFIHSHSQVFVKFYNICTAYSPLFLLVFHISGYFSSNFFPFHSLKTGIKWDKENKSLRIFTMSLTDKV